MPSGKFKQRERERSKSDLRKKENTNVTHKDGDGVFYTENSMLNMLKVQGLIYRSLLDSPVLTGESMKLRCWKLTRLKLTRI